MNNKKFKMTNELLGINGTVLYRIVALKNFNDVHIGDKGGFIEKEENLSHDGNCWVYGNAKVFNNATIKENAIVRGQYAEVAGHTKVSGNAIIEGNAIVKGALDITDFAKIAGRTFIQGYGNVVSGDTIIKGYEDKRNKTIGERKTKDDIAMSSGIIILGANIHNSRIFDNVVILDGASATIKNSHLSGNITIGERARISNASICGDFILGNNAIVDNDDYCIVGDNFVVYHIINNRDLDSKPTLAVSVGDKVYHDINSFKTAIKSPIIPPKHRAFYKSALKTAKCYLDARNK